MDMIEFAMKMMSEPSLTMTGQNHQPQIDLTTLPENSIIRKLPEKMRDGQIWMDDYDSMRYLGVYIGTIAFFGIIYHIVQFIVDKYHHGKFDTN